MLRAEKSACEKIESEYSEVLLQKQRQLFEECQARERAEAEMAQLKEQLALVRGDVEQEMEERLEERRHELDHENMLA